jgi:predicted ATPase
MAKENKQPEAKNRTVDLRHLYLDPNNYRLIHEDEQKNVTDDRIKDKDVVNRTYRLILGEKNQNIQDLINSFKSSGYLPVDQIQVKAISDEDFVVIEGNRRIAALKYLCNEYEQKSIDLGVLDKHIFTHVPVILYEDSDENHYLTLMALKHISGNRKWGEWNQAKLLETLTNSNLLEDEICKRIGISKVYLRRNIRALGLANQYRSSDYGDQFNESMFPIFSEAVQNPAIKDWVGWDDTAKLANNKVNCELFFSWLSKESVEDDSDNDSAGKIMNFKEPAISKRDDIRILSKILNDKSALKNLEEYRNLHEAYRTSDLIFKEKINDAINSIESDVAILGQLSITQEQTPSLEESLSKLRSIVEKARSVSFQGVEQTSLFYDRIDKHFSWIKIVLYRGLNSLEINALSKINIFAGLNNSGKTSLLEAVYLLCKQNDFNGIVDVIRRRGKIQEDHIPPRWLADQFVQTVHVEGEFDNRKAIVKIKSLVEEGTNLDRTHYLKSVEMTTQFETHQLESITRIYQGRGRETQADSIKLVTKVVFSSPFFLNESYHYTTFYHKSVQSKLLPKIFGFIKEKVVPTIKDIRLVDEFQRFLVDDEYFKQEAMDLTTYGEGLQRIFFTSLLFASAENGVVLIDEFENAIHTELLETFAFFIHSLAKEFNVQVFLTSHSKECIDAFVKSVPQDEIKDFSFHALVKNNNNEIIARDFDGEKFFKLLEAGDVDLRRAQ